jgi:hypothetical protein
LLLNWNPCDFQKNSDVCAIVENEIIGDISYLANQKHKLDDSIPNKSSIALLLTHESKSYLLLGDAHIDQIIESLYEIGFNYDNPLYVEFVKLSHHGSIRNINKDFLNIIRTNKYVICNPSATSKALPNKETIAQIAFFGKSLSSESIKEILLTKPSNVDLDFSEEDQKEFNFKITYENKRMEF